MTDIFREVEEDVRREQAEKLWKAWGKYLIALAVLVFIGIGGWQYWSHRDLQAREKVAGQFIAAERISNPRDAANSFVDIANSGARGYSRVARLAQANAMFAAGQQKEAIDLYKQLAEGDSGPVGSAARLRAAWGIADNTPRSELAKYLDSLTQPGNAWRQNAQEVLAYADYRAMDLKGAQAKYAALATDPEAPDALRGRARAMAAFLKAGGAMNYGTVPADVPVSPATPLAPAAPAQ